MTRVGWLRLLTVVWCYVAAIVLWVTCACVGSGRVLS